MQSWSKSCAKKYNSVKDDWIKSARMSSVKIMVSSHLVESVQQARKERFMLQDSVEKYDSFVFPDSLECVKPQKDSGVCYLLLTYLLKEFKKNSCLLALLYVKKKIYNFCAK